MGHHLCQGLHYAAVAASSKASLLTGRAARQLLWQALAVPAAGMYTAAGTQQAAVGAASLRWANKKDYDCCSVDESFAYVAHKRSSASTQKINEAR